MRRKLTGGTKYFRACHSKVWNNNNNNTLEPQLSGPQLSRLFGYPDFFSGPNFCMNIN